ncbi:MAG: hypothetical protein DWQ07_22570 [Chloroflexi bacterium]|nr:MAG: hypothetical protein DWQ07_22570 [Chloroflexota bacterium]MBL1193933.1 hypothetical protein [Chloroflexota bacterium]NOH11227.1 hypothetical protein [Chloroflexota bacterium]
MEATPQTQTKARICKSPNCFRPTSETYEYCCPACQVKSSHTNDHLGHWRDCNKRQNAFERAGYKKS